MSDPYADIVLAAAELKVTAMPQYQSFLHALEVLDKKLKADLLAAEPGGIFQAQGQAQVITKLRGKLEECLRLRDEMTRRK